MILVRNTFQVKFGRMKEASGLMKENVARAKSAGHKPGRLMTDVTGAFYTLVLELEYESMAEAEKSASEFMKLPGWQETYQKFAAVVDSGRREIFSVLS
jgi:NIPSNAP